MRCGVWGGNGGWPSARDVRRLDQSDRITGKRAAANTDAGREGKAGARAARDREGDLWSLPSGTSLPVAGALPPW